MAEIQGEAEDGFKYYEVESEDEKITGCYEKIDRHLLSSDIKYPIYKQTDGPFYLRINAVERASWVFLNQKGIKYE